MLSFSVDAGSEDSRDTLILDEEEEKDAKPIINELSILRTVSSSQSFRAEKDENLTPSQILGESAASRLLLNQQKPALQTQVILYEQENLLGN